MQVLSLRKYKNLVSTFILETLQAANNLWITAYFKNHGSGAKRMKSSYSPRLPYPFFCDPQKRVYRIVQSRALYDVREVKETVQRSHYCRQINSIGT